MTEVATAVTQLGGQIPGPKNTREELDPDTALALARELVGLVQQHDLIAQECSEELSLLLAGTDLAAQAGSLVETFARVDFRAAAHQLEELTALLERQVNEGKI